MPPSDSRPNVPRRPSNAIGGSCIDSAGHWINSPHTQIFITGSPLLWPILVVASGLAQLFSTAALVARSTNARAPSPPNQFSYGSRDGRPAMPTFGSQNLGREIYCCPVQGLHFAASAAPAHTSPSPDFLMSSCVFFVTASRPPIASSKSALTFSSILFCWSSSFDISRLSGQQITTHHHRRRRQGTGGLVLMASRHPGRSFASI